MEKNKIVSIMKQMNFIIETMKLNYEKNLNIIIAIKSRLKKFFKRLFIMNCVGSRRIYSENNDDNAKLGTIIALIYSVII